MQEKSGVTHSGQSQLPRVISARNGYHPARHSRPLLILAMQIGTLAV